MKRKTIFNRDNIFGTLFIFLTLLIIHLFPINGSIIDPVTDAISEFELTDLVFSKLREEPSDDPNILLINIGSLDRQGIAEEIRIINQFEPKVVGLDIFFSSKGNSKADSSLVEALSEIKNLVMISKPQGFDESIGKYKTLEKSDQKFLNNSFSGSATLITAGENQDDVKICRTFNPYFPIKGQKDELAFGVMMAKLFDSLKVERFLKRNNEVEVINFRGNVGSKFTTLDVDDVFNLKFSPDIIKGKIIIFGFLGATLNDRSWEDKFYTPINAKYIGRANPDMFGGVIHANITSMILNEDYINVIPDYMGIVLAVLVCFLNVAFFSWIYRKKELYYTILTKPIQFIEVILLLGITIWLFHRFSLKVNLTLTLVTILLIGDMLELYYNYIKQTFSTIKRKFLSRLRLVENGIS